MSPPCVCLVSSSQKITLDLERWEHRPRHSRGKNKVLEKAFLFFETLSNGLEFKGAAGPSEGPQPVKLHSSLSGDFVMGFRSLLH